MKNLPTPIRDSLAVRWGLNPGALNFLGGGEDWSDGTLFTAPAPGGDRVLKVLDFSAADAKAVTRVEERLRCVRVLGESGARIVSPLPTDDGALFATAEADGRLYLAYTYDKVTGRTLKSGDPSAASGALYRAVGAELGRLHTAWETRGEEPQADGTLASAPALEGWKGEMASFRNWCQEERVGRAWDRLRDALAAFPVTAATYGFVHNDAHLSNLLFDPDKVPDQGRGEPPLTVIDFDVAGPHWYLSDCAVALFSFDCAAAGGLETPAGPPPGFSAWAAGLFWEGYRRHRPVPDLTSLEVFLHYRRCLLFMPFQEATAQKPGWRQRWVARIEAEDRRLFG